MTNSRADVRGTCKFMYELRLHFQLNQTEMSHLLGISQSTVSKIEVGALKPEIVIWSRIQRLLMTMSESWNERALKALLDESK